MRCKTVRQIQVVQLNYTSGHYESQLMVKDRRGQQPLHKRRERAPALQKKPTDTKSVGFFTGNLAGF